MTNNSNSHGAGCFFPNLGLSVAELSKETVEAHGTQLQKCWTDKVTTERQFQVKAELHLWQL